MFGRFFALENINMLEMCMSGTRRAIRVSDHFRCIIPINYILKPKRDKAKNIFMLLERKTRCLIVLLPIDSIFILSGISYFNLHTLLLHYIVQYGSIFCPF